MRGKNRSRSTISQLPPEVREGLAMTAARQRKTVAEVLVESYAAALTK